MAGDRELKVKIIGDASGALKEFDKVGKAGDTMGGKLSGAGKAVAGLAIGAGVAAVGLAKGALEAVGESQKVNAQTEAVIRSTGGAARVSTAHIGDLSSQLQSLSGVEDETIQRGANMLLTFTNIRNGVGKGNDVFDQATKTVLDMSVALGQDTASSAVQLGKALNDPVKGVTALQKVGVTFTQQQKDQIKALVESGDVMGAQKVILAELSKEFGGSAKAAGEALLPTEKLKLKFGDLQEKIGAKLLPVMEKLTNAGIKVIDWLSHLSPGAQTALGVIAGLGAAVFVVVKAVRLWTAAQAALNVVMDANPVVLVAAALVAVGAGLFIAYQKIQPFHEAVDKAWQLLQSVFHWVQGNWPLLLAILTGPFGLAALAIARNFGTIKEAVEGGLRFVVDKFLAAAEWIIRGAAAAFGWIPGIGPKLKDAAKEFEAFRDSVNVALGGIQDKKVSVAVELHNQSSVALPKDTPHAKGIPQFAAGGVVPGPRGAPLLAVVHGGEFVVSNDMQRGGGSSAGGTTIENHYHVGTLVGSGGMREFVEMVTSEQQKHQKRNGRSPLATSR